MRSINLLPPKPPRFKGSPLILSLLVLLAVVSVTGQWYYRMTWVNEAGRYTAIVKESRSEIARLQSAGMSRTKAEQFQQASAAIAKLEDERPEWLPYLSPVVGYLPDKAKANYIGISEDGKMIQAELVFTVYQESINYIEKLEEAPALRATKISAYRKESEKSSGDSAIGPNQFPYKLVVEVQLNPAVKEAGR
ncbi:hypothetical protein [Paenibacillus radicis (ex Gao et al. 2016)]|uniref:Fimbrial assembly protein n=1 Tax=Paenibacillus radicis (ex Gao et al. 2016) TaxID=1737354 RepID=A0A917GST5_9BACL|nr:hypothetical protein [Paenibacillus radicis (ex Gao et al. 2016)]GGG55549.1 hypothetical protein GCM10010918_05570 [Paenibacillus radicis (ex Gao et al. 2016)]